MIRRNRLPRRISVLVLVAGLAVAAGYHLLSALEIGKIGAPTDIGGGLIAIAGYVITGIGVLMIARDIRRAT